ncbi:carbohydrate-binding domain-containing protein [Falsiroseomonas sp. CW058]|uniref:carbohydrate-binding domain-containing protein n=1 Tax=Falsiroseomonas sp. CW058 TaxID=3388664 RepID=UPI003D31C232
MTQAASTGLTALPETLRASSVQDSNNSAAAGHATEIGQGADELVLKVSGESWQGDAQFTVHVNGEQVGGVLTAVTQHGDGSDTVTLRGDWGADAKVSVAFLNDGWGGTADTDRNLHIDAASYNGEAIAGAARTLWTEESVTLTAGTPPADGGTAPPAQGADELVLKVSGESWQGDAQFTVQVNGEQVGGVLTAVTQHGDGSDTVTLRGDWGADTKVSVAFLNDGWGGTADTDRNLHIDSASYNGEAIAGAARTLWTEGSATLTAGAPPADGGEADGGEVDAGQPPGDAGGSTGGGTPPTGGATPDGYTLVLADDFSDGYSTATWGNPYHGSVYWNGAFTWNADDVAVRDGEMQVTITQQDDGNWTAGGFNSFTAGHTITYGKIEFDAKVPDHQGTMTAILTWPSSDNWPRDGEIDILETPFSENMFSTHYEGPNGEHYFDSIRSSTYDASEWHHYEVTWLPDSLTIEVDGQVMAHWTDPAEIPDVPHGFGAMGFVGSDADTWMGGAPDGSTPGQVTISLDNVRMYQADGIF